MPEMVPHGTLDFRELAEWGYEPADLFVFSSNINPYGPPPSVIRTVADSIDGATIALYPDRLSLRLREKLAEHHGIPPESILVGNGTADILFLLAVVFLRGKKVAILSPTFGEYANAANVVGVNADQIAIPGWRRRADGTYHPYEGQTTRQSEVARTARALGELAPDVVFICNPNSPTGEHWTPSEVETLMAAAPQALWIIDEAYRAFAPEPWSATSWCLERKMVVLHSMTKDFALGGLRLGYAAAPPGIVAALADAQPPWNVNALAQIAGEACMNELEWRKETTARLRKDTQDLRSGLTDLGYAPRPTTANYMLVPVADPADLRQTLLGRKIVVRDCTSFGLPSFIRLATQRPKDNQFLLDTLADLAQPNEI